MAGVEQEVKSESELSRERQAQIDKFGLPGLEEMGRLENEKRQRKIEAESKPDDEQAGKKLEIADKRLELFYSEHDAAGAFKFKRFGREVQSFFADTKERPKVIEQKENGEFGLTEGQENRRMAFINMGELDRFNKEGGGHAAGDAALAETSRTIERIVREKLKDKEGAASGYELLRYSGNEFMVSFSDLPEKEFNEVLQQISETRPSVPGVKEPAPLTATGVDLREAISLMNETQLGLAPTEKVEAGEDAARELVEVAKHLADFRLEKAKFESRASRVMEVMEGQGPEAAKFFDNYMKKTFSGTELASLKDFENLKAMGDQAFREKVSQMAETSAHNRLFEERKFESLTDGIIRKRLEARRVIHEGADKGEWPGSILSSDDRLAAVPEQTRGQAIIAEKKADAEAPAASPEDSELKRLEYQIEVAKRDAGTGLLDRGQHYEKLEKSLAENKDASVVFVDMGFLKYFDQKGGTDVGDSALKLAADIMERAVAESGVKAEVFRYGGDEFTIQVEGGDDKAAELVRKIHELRDSAGKVPSGARSKDEYAPTKLVFNTGACDKKQLDAVMSDLVAAGRYTAEDLADPERGPNIKAEVMTKIADVGLESEKAVRRFEQMIRELRDPAYAKDPQRKLQVDSLINFSNKAIFAEKGGKELLTELAGAAELSDEEVDRRIREFVADKVEESHDVKDGKRDLLDRMVEVHTKIRDLSSELHRAQAESEARGAEIVSLRSRLQVAEKERRQLIETRGKMDDAFKKAA